MHVEYSLNMPTLLVSLQQNCLKAICRATIQSELVDVKLPHQIYFFTRAFCFKLNSLREVLNKTVRGV